MVWQQAVMEDVRVGEQDRRWICGQLDTLLSRRVACEHRHAWPRPDRQMTNQRLDGAQLVADQRLGGIEIERAHAGHRQRTLERWQGERQAFATCGWAGQHDVLAITQGFDGRDLVCVQLLDTLAQERATEWRRAM